MMGFKDEVREAKQIAEELLKFEYPLEEICSHLNMTLEGFYYKSNDKLYRQNSPDYLPAIKIA